MLQFVVRSDGPEVTRSVICEKVPFTIGRGDAVDFHVSGPGVWDVHAEIVEGEDGKLFLQPASEAIVLINGERTIGKLLAVGDEIQLGSITLLVGLAPVQQKHLVTQEVFMWALVATIVGSQLALFAMLR